MTLKIVHADSPEEKDFLQLPVRLYRNVPCWIRPLDSDVLEVFRPATNKMYRSGDCIRWTLYDEKNLCIGRVAAFFDKRLWKEGKPKIGGMGFFECIDNQQAANLLFEACENWLKEKGLDGMDGPINFGDRDKNWGLLCEGFELEPNYGMPWTFPYYIKLFENYGFRVFYYQHTYSRPVLRPLREKLLEKYERVKQDANYNFCHYEPSQNERFVKAFTDIYNQAWSKHSGVAAMQEAHVRALFKKLKPVMDKRLLWFAFYEDRPIAFFLMLPELNQVFKHVNGKLDLIGKLKFLWYRYVQRSPKMFGVIFGVIPDYQGKGLEGAIVVACKKVVVGAGYREMEMNWIGDFNPKMIHLLETLDSDLVKRHSTNRLYFDRSYPFEREKSIG
jgi:GNAT superfamily N-acetyltransferase